MTSLAFASAATLRPFLFRTGFRLHSTFGDTPVTLDTFLSNRASSGSFHTKRRRGGVERRQFERRRGVSGLKARGDGRRDAPFGRSPQGSAFTTRTRSYGDRCKIERTSTTSPACAASSRSSPTPAYCSPPSHVSTAVSVLPRLRHNVMRSHCVPRPSHAPISSTCRGADAALERRRRFRNDDASGADPPEVVEHARQRRRDVREPVRGELAPVRRVRDRLRAERFHGIARVRRAAGRADVIEPSRDPRRTVSRNGVVASTFSSLSRRRRRRRRVRGEELRARRVARAVVALLRGVVRERPFLVGRALLQSLRDALGRRRRVRGRRRRRAWWRRMLVVIPSGGPRQQFRAAVADASTRRQQLRHRGATMMRIARVAVGDANRARACVRRARRGDVVALGSLEKSIGRADCLLIRRRILGRPRASFRDRPFVRFFFRFAPSATRFARASENSLRHTRRRASPRRRRARTTPPTARRRVSPRSRRAARTRASDPRPAPTVDGRGADGRHLGI
eukprot:29835-Pelagococcus_subviridis.AAC.12